jgi:Acetyltransferase (isoleucine patch superfamily)
MIIIKKFLSKVHLFLVHRQMRKDPERYQVDSTAILLDDIHFRFDVPGHNLNPAVVIGVDSMIGCNFIFESDKGTIKIGERCYISAGTNLISRDEISIGDDVWIAWGCYIYDHNSHSLAWQDRKNDLAQQMEDYKNSQNFILHKNWTNVVSKPIIIHDKVWIGFEAVILKGVIIGEGAIIAARSVVTKDVAPWTMVAGNPAKFVKEVNQSKSSE